MPTFDVRVKGDQEVVRKFDEMGSRATDLRPLGHALIAILAEGEQRMWNRPRGQRWAPLAESTLERKRREGLPAKILVASGALRDSLVGGGAGAVRDINMDSIRFGTSVLEAKFQVKGTAEPSKGRRHGTVTAGREGLHTPARKILAAGAREKRELRSAIAAYLVGPF